MASWKELTRNYLGKHCSKFAHDIKCDLLCVIEGIKPALLFDYAMTEPETLKTFLTAVISNGLLPVKNAQLGIIEVGLDVLVYNLQAMTCVVADDIKDVTLIDVTGREGNPRIMNPEECHKITDVILTEIRQICQSFHSEGEELDHIPIHKINDSVDINLSTLFGYLLGYPVIYWFDVKCPKENCLSMLPLTVFTVTGDFPGKTHTIFSYSIPENILPSVKHLVEAWELKLKSKDNSLDFVCNVCFSSKTVTLPAVNL